MESIRGYVLTSLFTTAGGGQCQWAFGEKDGNAYFIKKYLAPKHPDGISMHEVTRKRKLAQCEAFERHHRSVMDKLKAVGDGGNLIAAVDFFREGACYYKVTHKVVDAGLSSEAISSLPIAARILILRSVTHSLQILHRSEIVHADLKPTNILIKKTESDVYVAKLIDFDNSYFSGRPPDASDVVGDVVYYAPEVARYIQEDPSVPAENLTLASDVFALGLVFAQYLTGRAIHFPDRYRYAHHAVLDGHELRMSRSGDLPEYLCSLIDAMLVRDMHQRPPIGDIFRSLKESRIALPVEFKGKSDGSVSDGGKHIGTLKGTLTLDREGSVAETAPETLTTTAKTTPGALKGTMTKSKASSSTSAHSETTSTPSATEGEAAPPETKSGLRGTLLKKRGAITGKTD